MMTSKNEHVDDGPLDSWRCLKAGDKKDEFIAQPIADSKDDVYNGRLIAQATWAAFSTVPTNFDINSCHTYLVRRVDPQKPFMYRVQRLRDGRNFIFRSVELLQDATSVFHFEFTFRKRPADVPLRLTNARFPAVPQSERVASLDELRVEFTKRGYTSPAPFDLATQEIDHHVEVRPCAGIEFLIGPQRPTLRQNVWLRYRGVGDRHNSRHASLVLSYLADIGLAFTGGLMPDEPRNAFRLGSSLDHSGWIHEPKFNDYDQCLLHGRSNAVAHSRLWTRAGCLLASFTHETPIQLLTPLHSRRVAKL